MPESIKISWDTVNLKNILIVGILTFVILTLFSEHKVSEIPKALGMVLNLGFLWVIAGCILGYILGLIIAFLIDDTAIQLPDRHYILFSKKLALIGAVAAPIIWAGILITQL